MFFDSLLMMGAVVQAPAHTSLASRSPVNCQRAVAGKKLR